MATDIQIINIALTKLGEQPITSLSGLSETEKLASRTYQYQMESLLSEFPWNFAIKRAAVTADASPPAWGFARRYAIPGDLIRLVEVSNESDYPWKNEGGWILTDMESPVNIRYVYLAPESSFSPEFVEALAARLAMEWAEPLSQTASLVNQMAELYKNKLRVARVADSQSDRIEPADFPDFIDARF